MRARGSFCRLDGASSRRIDTEPADVSASAVPLATTSVTRATRTASRRMVPLGQAAEWVIVPWYWPTTTPAGIVTMMVGFHVADVPPDAVTAANAMALV